MPGQDGTGPLGQGPLTGGGLGPCGRGLRRRAQLAETVELSKEDEIKVLEKRLKELKA